MTQTVRPINEYQATVLRKAWLRNQVKTVTVEAYSQSLALKYLRTEYPKATAITTKYIRTIR